MINFTAWPEMIAWPYLMLNGWLPYRDIAIAHNPLLLVDLAIFYKIFGIGILQLKIYTWILIFLNTYIAYYVTKKLWSKNIGILSGLFYLILCIVYEGNGLWFDLALAPFALLLYLFVKEKRYLLAGLTFGLGFLTKQTFIYFLIPVALSMTLNLKSVDIKKFILGNLYIFIPFLIILSLFGILDDFYKWTIEFGILYLPNATGQMSLPSVKSFLFATLPFLIFLFKRDMAIWAVVGMLGTYPRWELFHFQPSLPFISIALAIFIDTKRNTLLKLIVLVITILYLIFGLDKQIGTTIRFFDSQVVEVIEYVKNTDSKEIYVTNYWDNIYSFTNTLPASKPLIPYIPWYLEYKNNREVVINNLRSKMPSTIVIGERDNNFPDLYNFVNLFYMCRIVSGEVELCEKN